MEDLPPKIVKAELGEVEHSITSEIDTMDEADNLAKNILLNMPHYESFSNKFGVNAEGGYVLIFKLKQASLPPVAHIKKSQEEEKKGKVPKKISPKKVDQGGQFKIWDEFMELAKKIGIQYPNSGKAYS
jgi:hypothetical protein